MNKILKLINKGNNQSIEKKMIIIKLTACFISLALANISNFYQNIFYFNIILLLYILYNTALWSYLLHKPYNKLSIYSLYIDIPIVSILIALRGGICSDLYLLYFVILIYTITKKQKYLLVKASAFILIAYSAACLIFSDIALLKYNFLISQLLIRISIIIITVYLLYNIKSEMNYFSLLRYKAYEMALIDPLTRVYNRNILNTLNKYQKQNPYNLSFSMIDIDDFKLINDTYGHQKGDEILRHLCDIIKSNIREDDICIRYGGEEFLLAFKNTDADIALKILNRIKSAFSEQTFFHEGAKINCTISVGHAYSNEQLDINTIISNADTALYQAKRNGKNNIIVYSYA